MYKHGINTVRKMLVTYFRWIQGQSLKNISFSMVYVSDWFDQREHKPLCDYTGKTYF